MYTDPEKSRGFTLADNDTARYVWRIVSMQHIMFTNCDIKQMPEQQQQMIQQSHQQPQLQQQLSHQSIQENIHLSRENLLQPEQKTPSNWTLASETHTQPQHLSHQYLWSENSASEQSIRASNLAIANSQLLTENNNQYNSQVFDSTNSITSQLQNWNINNRNGSNMSLNNLQNHSSSCFDLSNNNIYHETEARKPKLPQYRPAPDYETAVLNKYRTSLNELRLSTQMLHMPNSEMVSDQHLNIYGYESQNDIHKLSSNPGYNMRPSYPDVTQTMNPIVEQSNNLPIDVNTHQKVRLKKISKPPPPPYPVNRINSSSTPDLALASQRAAFGYRGVYVSGSSPDLVSTRNFGRSNAISNPLMYQPLFPIESARLGHSSNYIATHGTYEHLNIIDHPNYNLLLPAQQQQQQRMHNVFDGNKIIYCMPQNVDQVDQVLFVQDINTMSNPQIVQQQQHQQQQQQTNNTILHQVQDHHVEPIYENVPFSYQNDNMKDAGRNRTSSIQSAPGGMRNGERHFMSNPSILTEEQVNIKTSPNKNNSINNNKYPPPIHPYQSQSVQMLPQKSNRDEMVKHENQSKVGITRTSSHTIVSQSNDSGIAHSSNLGNDSKILNSSYSSSILDSGSHSSSATSLANSSSMNSSEAKSEKRKKRSWGIWSRAKLGGSKNSDKNKSATLGREKDKNRNTSSTSQDDPVVWHRWSTGVPKSQSLPSDISKEKLVST